MILFFALVAAGIAAAWFWRSFVRELTEAIRSLPCTD